MPGVLRKSEVQIVRQLQGNVMRIDGGEICPECSGKGCFNCHWIGYIQTERMVNEEDDNKEADLQKGKSV